ncbi:MAG: dihydrofolate reductase family protein [Thermomicrobiales bacterium]
MAHAVALAKDAAGEKSVALLGGTIARQCLHLGLVDEIQLHIVPILLGNGISLFGGLGETIALERIESAGFASGVHLRYRVVRDAA